MLIPRTILSLTTASNYKLLLQEIRELKSIFCKTAWVVTEQKWFSLPCTSSAAELSCGLHRYSSGRYRSSVLELMFSESKFLSTKLVAGGQCCMAQSSVGQVVSVNFNFCMWEKGLVCQGRGILCYVGLLPVVIQLKILSGGKIFRVQIFRIHILTRDTDNTVTCSQEGNSVRISEIPELHFFSISYVLHSGASIFLLQEGRLRNNNL